MTPTTASEIFESQAAEYEAPRRRLIPPFDAFYGAAVDAVRLATPSPKRILDLGAGTGLLSCRIAGAYPGAQLVLTDGAPAMLAEAEQVLGDRASYVVADLAEEPPAGPWCAVVSALAIHHLDDAGKRRLFARVFAELGAGGVFVNAEQVLGPTAFFAEANRAWHEAGARAAGSDDAEWAGAEERMRYDRCATVEEQLGWLREAGFEADCVFKDHRFAVLVGRKPRPGS